MPTRSKKIKTIDKKSFFIQFLVTLIGTFVYAIGLNTFMLPHKFLSGGFTGIAMILYYLTGFPIGLTNLLANIPLLFLSYRYMGKRYTLFAIISTVLCSGFLDLTVSLSKIVPVHTPIVSAIAGAFIIGSSMGLLYRYGSSTGGLDIIGAMIKKYYNIEIGNVVLCVNILIILSSMFIFQIEPAVCTLIAMYLNAMFANRVVLGFAKRKAAFIVSDYPLEVSDTILRNIHHGATLLYGQGTFSGREKQIVFSIISLTQISKLRKLVEDVDKNAFIFIIDATDVIGKGFTAPNFLKTGRLIPSKRYFIDEEGEMVATDSWENVLHDEAVHYKFLKNNGKSKKE